ncbi:MAG: EAL domain-containing protein [Alphaproteobacteria bacterium]|nr:EAL domain-containing protein [Alphaproteobacteria bacterium]
MYQAILENMKINTRMYLALAIPVLVLLALAGDVFYQGYAKTISMHKVHKLEQFSSYMTNIIHDLQAERDDTVAVIAHEGDEAAVEVLARQRNITNRHLAAYEEEFKTAEWSIYGQDFLRLLKMIELYLQELQDFRALVDNGNETSEQAFTKYDAIINEMLDGVIYMSHLSDDAFLTNKINALISFLKMKELAGVESALGTHGYVMGEFDANTHKEFIAMVDKQEAYYEMFEHFADPAQITYVEQKLSNPIFKKIGHYREMALNSVYKTAHGAHAIHDMTGDTIFEWKQLNQTKNNIYKDIEDYLSDEIGLYTKTRDQALQAQLYLIGSLIFISLVAVFGFGWVVAKSIVNPIQLIAQYMRRLADNDLEANLELSTNRTDEVGDMVKSLAVFKTNATERKVNREAREASSATELAKSERLNIENISLANMDTLTSLPNRRNFFSYLEEATQLNDDQTERKLVVGLLDLDGFKRINDVFGHPAGDDLLVKSSQRIKDILGDDIILARLGGDEFGLVLTKPDDIKNVLQLGTNICEAMSQTFHLKEGSVQIGATIGFVEHPSMAPTSQLLFERADYALCYSKQHSKGEPVIFSHEHETIIRDMSNIEHQLRESDLEQELSVVFQPIIDIENKKTMGFEALARWDNASLGKVRPDIFIRAAEQMGTIGKLTTILLRKALNAACDWPDDIYLSFNLSIYDLSSPRTVLGLVTIVEKSNFPSNRIVFEITETAVMNDFKQASEALQMLKLQGAQIALDDFGTGYSSLSYVQRMPLDRLKIDRSFILDIETDEHTRNIVRTIFDLCNNLNLCCIVEGVETAQQLAILKQMGFRYIQGYYFSQPLLPADALEFINYKDDVYNKLIA